MEQPAAVQIRRWFVLLVSLLLLVGLGALGSSLVTFRSVRAVSDRAAPLAAATAAVQHEIAAAQTDLFRYLSEFSESVSSALDHLTTVDRHLSEARKTAGSPDAEKELDEIQTSVERYRKVLELMPRTAGASRDWSRLQEYSRTAVALGNAVQERAARMAETAQTDIRERNRKASQATAAAMGVSGACLALSAFSVFALRRWWERFQDQILGM